MTWVTGEDSRPEQWAWSRFGMELRGLPSGAVALVSWMLVSWGVRCTRQVAGLEFRCRAVVPGGGFVAVSQPEDSHMSGETSECCSGIVLVRLHTEEIWSCQYVGSIGVEVALASLCTTG